MKTIDIKIAKSYVYEEIAKASSYIGVKKKEEDGSYERIFVKDSDHIMLERLWDEACQDLIEELKEFSANIAHDTLNAEKVQDSTFSLQLNVSSSYREDLNTSVQNTLAAFIVNTILAKWCIIADKDDAEGYAILADGIIKKACRMIYDKKRPERVPVEVTQ